MAHRPVPRRVVVKTHRPWLAQILVALVIAAFIGQGWWLFDYGRTYGRSELVKLRHERDRVRNVVKTLGQQNSELRQQLAVLERGGQIDKIASEEVQRDLKAKEAEIVELKEELEFYRGIVTPEGGTRGIKVQSFAVVKSPEVGKYHYKLVLVQVLRNDRQVRGHIDVKLEGTLEGRQKSYSLTKVATDKKLKRSPRIGFKFKYYQNIEGYLKFPDGFVPGRVKIVVVAQGRKAAKISKTYEWQEIAS